MIEPPSFDAGAALLNWVAAVLACAFVALMVGFAAAFVTNGLSGPRTFWRVVKRGIRDLTRISTQRIGAVATLTIKESVSRKAFVIGVIFLALFMFGGWFLGDTVPDKPALPYITFVMSAMYFLLTLMAILIACWGLPADIKAKSLHTVVTKPVRRSEIVIGRIVGYSSVLLFILAATSFFGYFWIQRQVPDLAQDQLLARVPVFGKLTYLDRNGEVSDKGTNVGNIWEYRGYIEGLTKARAIWKFDNLDVQEFKQRGGIRMEQSFEAFRTYKGDVEEQVRYSITLINPEADLRVPMQDTYRVYELKDDPELSVVEIPQKIEYYDSYDRDAEARTVDLFDDIFNGDELTVEVACVDAQQFLGCAEGDLFIRMQDRSFLTSYAKATVGLGLLLVLLVSIGTTSSCFLKGPVSTLLTATVIILGNTIYTYIEEVQKQRLQQGRALGGGVLESVYRLVTKMNQTSPLPDNLGVAKVIIERLDESVFNVLFIVQAIIPDLSFYNMNRYTANGFDVPWAGALLPSIMTTIGFFIPLIILGYFSLQLRELEHK